MGEDMVGNLSSWLLGEKCSGEGNLNFKLGGYVMFLAGMMSAPVVAMWIVQAFDSRWRHCSTAAAGNGS